MKSRILLKAVTAVLAASTCASVAAEQEAKTVEPANQKTLPIQLTEDKLAWGDTDPSGFQMGAWQLPPKTPAILCAIRNQGKSSIRYNLCFLGYWEAVSIFARPEGVEEWTRIPRKKSILRAYESVGPSIYKVVELLPGQQIPDWSLQNRYKFEIPKPPTAPLVPSSSRIQTIKTVGQMPVAPQLPPHTLSVNLLEFDWPASWKGNVELRVEQRLISDETRPSWKGTLKSGALKIPLSPLRAGDIPIAAPISDVVLEKGKSGRTLTGEEFNQLMKTAEPMSQEEYWSRSIPIDQWYRGSFSTPLGIYHFRLGSGGAHFLIPPGGTSLLFKFNQDAEKQ